MQMKKIIGVGLVLFLAALAFPLSNQFAKRSPAREQLLAQVTDPEFRAVAPIFEKKCLDCHSAYSQFPFYTQFPVAKQIIDADIQKARAALDMGEVLFGKDHNVDEVTLAKIEYMVSSGQMPPLRYKLLHWDAGLTEKEKVLILSGIYRARSDKFNTQSLPLGSNWEVLYPLSEPTGLDPQKVALGNQLFHDTRLSHDNTLSCASCHDLKKGGADGAKVSTGINGQKGPINSPTVFNAVFNTRQFWDGRAATLAEQAAGPIHNPLEMGSNWEEVLPKLKKDPEYVKTFKTLYPQTGLTSENITDAIAAFEASLVTLDSRFDLHLRGDKTALNAEEKRGYDLFKSVGCTTCHLGRAVGGQSFEKMGIARDYFKDRGQLTDADYGLYNFTKKESDRYKFKVPTLRNIELTAPYFHDGSVAELDEAVRLMAKYELGKNLSNEEVRAITAFLRTLTGKYQDKTLSLESSLTN